MGDFFLVKALNSDIDFIKNKALDEIYQKYSHLVVFVAAKYLGDSLDMDDIVNEVFLALYENRKKITNLKYFLTTVAKNKAINLAKSNSKYVVDTFDSLGDANENSGYYRLIKIMKECISTEDVEIIIQHSVFGITLKEIAQKSNINKNTIESRYKRALVKVKKYMEAQDEKR